MVKPKKCRMVSSLPNVTYFKPAGIPLRFLNEVCLSVEEAEALRLKDLEGLEQVEGAVSMGVSRPTFQRVLSSARKKVADALLNGKAIKIEGGTFKVTGLQLPCRKGQNWIKTMDMRKRNSFQLHLLQRYRCENRIIGRSTQQKRREKKNIKP